MGELDILVKDLLSQRMCSYVDCFTDEVIDKDDEKIFHFKRGIDTILYNNLEILSNQKSFGNVRTDWYSVSLKNRKISIFNSNSERVLNIDVSKGYVNILPGETENSIKIEYNGFRADQINYKPIYADLYPYYGLNIIPFIFNNTFIYNINVLITMSPADEKLYKVELTLPILEKGIDGIVESAIDLYNLVLSRDFLNFFAFENIKILSDDYNDDTFKVIDHHYTEHCFLVEDSQGKKIQLPYLYYFTNMIVDADNPTTVVFDE